MDDNTRQVLIAVASALGGLLTGVLVAKVGLDHSRSLDSDRARREDRHRNRDDKIQAFSAFLTAIENRVDWLIEQENIAGLTVDEDDDIADSGADPSPMLQTIILLSPNVEPSATKLWNWSLHTSIILMRWSVTDVSKRGDKPELDVEEYHRLRDATIAAMHVELGIAEPRVAQSAERL